MAEAYAACSRTILGGKWKNWCRLCAKANTQYINVIVGQNQEEYINENTFKSDRDLTHDILEFFRIHIKEDDKLPQIICKECHEVVLSLIKFNERAKKVQQMYDDLQNSIGNSTTNLQMLLEKYGINRDNENLLTQQNDVNELGVEEIFVPEAALKDEKKNDFYDPIGDGDRDMGHDSYSSRSEDGFSTDSESSSMDISLSKLKATEKKKNIGKDKQYENSCQICTETFKRRSNYTLHMKKKHGVLFCLQCTNSYKTESEMKEHMQVHKKLWACLHCDKKFERKGLRSKHMKAEHYFKEKTNQSFVCENCGEPLRTRKKLKKHMLTHEGYVPTCKECGKTFKSNDGLRRHVQIHGDKHICNVCGKELSSRVTYNRHMLVHSDALKHKCDVCGRGFKRARALKNHLLAHTGLRPYKCDFCEKTFSTGSSCRLHKKTMHPHELAELEASGVKQYTQNIPNLEQLKAVARTGTNFRPLMSKQNGFVNLNKTTIDDAAM
ncbi:zinc finger protein weckle-like [Eurosta solidaginis]|uniref:zinc finger protein weckle-like n=1 Tax=Eurosta solidaginis TaxID=178769 RepID=UPI0035314CB2